ncbi:MAG: YsnF/AvaK domain-containing protein [Bryobacterales bacterium]|nr:YsnF/AvaK domain-containing protein [Bryobacterales bacterium]
MPEDPEVVIPVVAEELMVDKERVPTGSVRVHRHVETHEEKLALPLVRERVDVRRVPIGKIVDGPLPVRKEGDTTIVPVVEEVLVARTEFRLVEEIRITRTAIRDHHSETVTLHRQRAEVERVNAEGETKTLDQPFIKDENMLPRA